MHMGNSHKHENSKHSKATLSTYDILDKREKVKEQSLGFQKWEWGVHK